MPRVPRNVRRERFVPVYICPYEGCERGQNDFAKKNNLYQHYLIHIECKATCNACSTSFTSLATLIRHARYCGDDFFNSSPHDAKIMVDLIVSCRRKLEEHVSERIKARRASYPLNRGIKKKPLPPDSCPSGGQISEETDALFGSESSPISMPDDDETIVPEISQQSCDGQTGTRKDDSTIQLHHQPHRWIPDLVPEHNIEGHSKQKVHRFEDFTCPHGECSKRKRDWKNKDRLLKHYYSHFSCSIICNTCDREIFSLESLVVHAGLCKGFLSSNPEAAIIRSELMNSCKKHLNNKLANRFTSGLAEGERDERKENSKSQWNYLLSCTTNPKLPFPDQNLSELQASLDVSLNLPRQDPRCSITDVIGNISGSQQSCKCNRRLLPKDDARPVLLSNYRQLPELAQNLDCHRFDAQTTAFQIQEGNQSTNSLELEKLVSDVPFIPTYPSDPSLDEYQALPGETSGLNRASFDSIITMDPSFYSQWTADAPESLTTNGSEMNGARLDPVVDMDHSLSSQSALDICNTVLASRPGHTQARVDPVVNIDPNIYLPSAVPVEGNVYLPPPFEANTAFSAGQFLQGTLFDPTIPMDTDVFCFPPTPIVDGDEYMWQALQARPSPRTTRIQDCSTNHNQLSVKNGGKITIDELYRLLWS